MIAGKPCRNWAVEGSTVCRMHGAGSPKVAAKAAERVEEARIRRALDRYTPEPVHNPLRALAEVAGRIVAFVDVAEDRVRELDRLEGWSPTQGEQVRAAVSLFERALDAARKVLVDMAKLDLDERLVRIDETTARMFADLIKAVMADPAIALTPEQKAKVPGIFRRHLAVARGEEPDEAS